MCYFILGEKIDKKITIVSTSDRGGAGKAATRLHKGFLSLGIESNILYLFNMINLFQNQLSIFLRMVFLQVFQGKQNLL